MPPAETATSIFGEDGFTFGDLIDIVNPLQHIPVVSNIYRKITGDTIAPAMEIAGGALFGGPLGAAISLVTTAFQSYNKSSDSVDPNSPYKDKQSTTIDPTAIVNNSSQQFPLAIGNNDYSSTGDLEINKTDYNDQSPERTRTWVLSSENINRAGNTHVSINTLQEKHVYQPSDGITNIATNAIESYTDVITSNKTPSNSVDIIIGSNSS